MSGEIEEVSLEEAIEDGDICIGMGTVLRNTDGLGLYIIAQVETSQLCAICIEPERDVNRYQDPAHVHSIWNMTESEIASILGGGSCWTVLLGNTNRYEYLKRGYRLD